MPVFNSQTLPAPRPGRVWGLLIYPGGRKELRQYPPDMLQDRDEAVRRLEAGREARVRLDDAGVVVAMWQARKKTQ